MVKNRFFTFVVILAVVAVIALTVREAVATTAIAPGPGAQESQRLQLGRAADAARWTAMGEYYEELKGSHIIMPERSADAARWAAMGEYYRKLSEGEAQNLARARAADAARWAAMDEYYSKFDATTP